MQSYQLLILIMLSLGCIVGISLINPIIGGILFIIVIFITLLLKKN